jgi:UDP-N-acetylmuramyl pentapeptide phosphotransferase/UDP-N-acetylglucosamine-1-phosphate transferase
VGHVQSLPLFVAAAAAFLIAPPALRALAEGPLAKPNYRGRVLACPLGVMIVAAAVLALAPLALAQQLAQRTVLRPELAWVAVYVLGVAMLGLVDDALAHSGRGWRGHAGAVLAGGFSTGALKAVGSAGLAAYVMAIRGVSAWHFLLGAGVLVLSTNLFNLLDLRPGRSIKVFALLGVALTLGATDLHPLWALGVFVGPILVAGVYDLREEALLGDTGANMVGAVAGAWLVLTLSATGQLIALVLLAAITAYGEFRSITDLVERVPMLRELDSWGRTRDATDA